MSFGGGWRGGGGGGGSGGGGGYRGGSSSSSRQSTGSRAPCKFWAAGTCNRGASCNFSHDAPRGASRTLNNSQQAAANPFGAPQQQSNPWGDSSAATGAGVWGTGGAVQPSNPFQSQPTSFSSLGGGGGINGGANSNPFGAFSQPAAAANLFSSFAAQPTQQQQPFGASAFDASPFASANPGFGASNTNNNASPFSASAFGTAADNTAAAAQTNPFAAFSQPAAAGGAAASPFASAFGTAPSSLAASNPFAPAQSTASPFATPPATSAFGQPQPQQTNLFPSQQLSSSNPFQSLQPSSNPFQALQQPSTASPFGAAPAAAPALPQPTRLACGHTSLAQCALSYKQDCEQMPYPFTSYTHDKCDGPCIIGDVSYEEWRWEVVEAEAAGRLAEVQRKYEERRAEMNRARELMYSKPELLHRDISGWTFEQQVEAVRRGGVLDGAAGAASVAGGMDAGMGRDVSSAMAASSPTVAAASPFSAFAPSAAAAAPSLPAFGTPGAATPSATSTSAQSSFPISPGPPGGAALQLTAAQKPAPAAVGAAPISSQVKAGVVMSEAEVEQAWRAPAFAWGRIPELAPPAVG